jgi:hypothetical protein
MNTQHYCLVEIANYPCPYPHPSTSFTWRNVNIGGAGRNVIRVIGRTLYVDELCEEISKLRKEERFVPAPPSDCCDGYLLICAGAGVELESSESFVIESSITNQEE